MNKLQYLTPGPGELYFTVNEHIKTALQEKVPAISHRSTAFQAIYQHAEEQMRVLLGLPASHTILFTASATEVWERVLENCVVESSFHMVNGSFSKRFFDFAKALKLTANAVEKPLGEGFNVDEIKVESQVEAICATNNETSAGTSFDEPSIHALHDKYPNKLMIVDAVSSMPYPSFDWTKVDSLFFSVQKGMGLPAGLGVWVVNEKCIAAYERKAAKGLFTGTLRDLGSMLEKARKNQTVETPNMLAIYLLGKVAEDMNRKGIEEIRKESRYKAALLYQAFNDAPHLSPFVEHKPHRSKTVAIANVKDKNSTQLVAWLKTHGLVVGQGYADLKQQQIRVANFPTHSKETIERLSDLLVKWTQ